MVFWFLILINGYNICLNNSGRKIIIENKICIKLFVNYKIENNLYECI